MANLYIGLLHHPIQNRRSEIVTTAITTIDVHDIARTARTYGVVGYHIVTPLVSQQQIASRIVDYWTKGGESEDLTHRGEALALIEIVDRFEISMAQIEAAEGAVPLTVGTSARDLSDLGVPTVEYQELKRIMEGERRPIYLLFGTGWGIADELLERFDCLLPPIRGYPCEDGDSYNHLSVRAAVAIILDRLRGGPSLSRDDRGGERSA
ncbi:MAG: RNA methyltransferase [Candidatus Bipolaricaulia bacterium]